MRRVSALCIAAALTLAGASTAFASDGNALNSGSANPLTVAVYGDAPYGVNPADTSQFEATPAFIEAVNRDPKVRLVVHVGDIHSGKQFCTEAYDRSVFDLWTEFKDPLVFTPGDNEWSDCHKVAQGGGLFNSTTGQIDYVRDSGGQLAGYAGGDPLANLGLVRSIFFAEPGLTLGGRKERVVSQANAADPEHPSDAQYVENVMWEESQTLFVTLNIPGGSNNDKDKWYKAPITSAQQNETAQRTAADLRWLDAAFAQAQADGAQSVVIVDQADMWDLDGTAPAEHHLAGYDSLVDGIANNTAAFGGPVMLLEGDSHVYRSDNPLSAADPLNSLHPGHDVANLHRVVVHGSTAPLEYLRLSIDPRANQPASATTFGPFSWERVQP
jgi:Calcineurin-like phosphoesterase